MADADSLAAALAGIRGRSADVATAFATGRGGNAAARESAPDVPRLLAAVEAALRLADGWDAASRKVTGVLAEAGMPAAVEAAGTPAAGNRRAAELRQAITRKLLGEE